MGQSSDMVTARSITAAHGFLAAGTTCGIKPSGKPDMALIVSDRPAVAAGVLTRNKLPGAPLVVTRRHLRSLTARAIVCNSGIANDATGRQGIENAAAMCRLVAEACVVQPAFCRGAAPLRPRQVLVASTGVIGPQLPMDKIARGIGDMASKLDASARADADAAGGIMTTDLRPKAACVRFNVGGRRVTLGGIAKGSGMIAPNMATMLVFLTTDAAFARTALRQALRSAVGESFNRISVDGHTSPSDMVLLLANGAAGNRTIATRGRAYDVFVEHLTALCRDLAYQIVADGEGATRVFRVRVTGASSVRDADAVGRAVVNSPLVKAAVHGGDPNWGRIVTAAANSSARLRGEAMSLSIGPAAGRRGAGGSIAVFHRGTPVPRDAATQRGLEKLMRAREVVFALELGQGRSEVEWLGCDLSREYVRINADYTT